MPTVNQYQQRAADCLREAGEAHDPNQKALLLEMAQGWVRLAAQVEGIKKTDAKSG